MELLYWPIRRNKLPANLGNFSRFVLLAAVCVSLRAETKVVWQRIESAKASRQFVFDDVPAPRRADAGEQAKVTILSGSADPVSGGLAALSDGTLPQEEDAPDQNFFFAAGTEGGWLRMDLGRPVNVKEINTYSWHPRERGPQVYKVYAASGEEENFSAEPKPGADLHAAGWKKLAEVDTRAQGQGGQYGVSIRDSEGALGRFRYLLFDVSRTEDQDAFGHTFFSEIDVIDADASSPGEPAATSNNELSLAVDATAAPDLTEWAKTHIEPLVAEWYPKLTKMLASEGYEPPMKITIRFRNDMRGGIPAAAGGSTISLNAPWFRRNREGEAIGSVVHELVHVVQNYGRARRTNPNATRTPGWLVEGIADYVRWFLYEPESMGAEITPRNFERARYDSSYRITGNFLNWVAVIYGHDVIWKLNAAAREGRYSEELWRELTGQTLQELGADWKTTNERRLVRARLIQPKPEEQ